MSRWTDRAALLTDAQSRRSALRSADLRPRREAPETLPDAPSGLASLLQGWRDGLAVSSLAYLLREHAWSPSSWQAAPARTAPRRSGVVARRRMSLHLP